MSKCKLLYIKEKDIPPQKKYLIYFPKQKPIIRIGNTFGKPRYTYVFAGETAVHHLDVITCI